MRDDVTGRRRSWSLTVLLALAFAGLSATALLVSGSFEMFLHYRTQRGSIEAEQKLIARDAASEVAGFVRAKFDLLEAAVELGEPATSAQADRTRILEILLGLEPAFRHLVMLGSAGDEWARVTRLSRASW